jgi:xanthine/uracil permease
MNPQLLVQAVLSFANALTPIVNVLAIGGLFVSLARVAVRWWRGTSRSSVPSDRAKPATKSTSRSWRVTTHPWIFAAAPVALVTEGIGFVVFSSPMMASSAERTAAANVIAMSGLVISMVAWLPSLYASLRLAQIQRWAWFVGLLLGGLLLYIPALTERDFLSYCLVGAVPAVFGVLGPRTETANTDAVDTRR